jgi:hypothetical protein
MRLEVLRDIIGLVRVQDLPKDATSIKKEACDRGLHPLNEDEIKRIENFVAGVNATEKTDGMPSHRQSWLNTSVHRAGMYPERAVEKGVGEVPAGTGEFAPLCPRGYDGGEERNRERKMRWNIWITGLSVVNQKSKARLILKVSEWLDLGETYRGIRGALVDNDHSLLLEEVPFTTSPWRWKSGKKLDPKTKKMVKSSKLFRVAKALQWHGNSQLVQIDEGREALVDYGRLVPVSRRLTRLYYHTEMAVWRKRPSFPFMTAICVISTLDNT